MGELKGSVLQRARKYFGKVGRLNEPNDVQWDTIASIYRIRNVFVHNGGMVTGTLAPKEVDALIASHPGLTISHGFVRIEDEFCPACIAKIGKFLAGLQAQIRFVQQYSLSPPYTPYNIK